MRTTHPSPPAVFLENHPRWDLQDVGRNDRLPRPNRVTTCTQAPSTLFFPACRHTETYIHKGNKETTPATACLLACTVAHTYNTPDHRKPEPHILSRRSASPHWNAVRRSPRLSHQRLSSRIINSVFLPSVAPPSEIGNGNEEDKTNTAKAVQKVCRTNHASANRVCTCRKIQKKRTCFRVSFRMGGSPTRRRLFDMTWRGRQRRYITPLD